MLSGIIHYDYVKLVQKHMSTAGHTHGIRFSPLN